MKESGVLAQTTLVFGQMDEPPGVRFRVAQTGVTMAEYFRDELGADVLLFIDNIFRYMQAGSEVSALMGRMPSAVGYQPTLAHRHGRARRAHHVDAQRFDHLGASGLRAGRRLHRPRRRHDVRASRRDDRALASDLGTGHLSGRRSAGIDVAHSWIRRSSAKSITPSLAACKKCCSAIRTLQDIIAILGVEELSEEDKMAVGARAPHSALLLAAVLRCRAVHGPRAANTSSCRETIASFKEILEGKVDDLAGGRVLLRRRRSTKCKRTPSGWRTASDG